MPCTRCLLWSLLVMELNVHPVPCLTSDSASIPTSYGSSKLYYCTPLVAITAHHSGEYILSLFGKSVANGHIVLGSNVGRGTQDWWALRLVILDIGMKRQVGASCIMRHIQRRSTNGRENVNLNLSIQSKVHVERAPSLAIPAYRCSWSWNPCLPGALRSIFLQ